MTTPTILKNQTATTKNRHQLSQQQSESIQIYVISLHCDNERKKNINAQFKTTSTLFTFFPATDLRNKNILTGEFKAPKKRAATMTAAEIGCSLSHIRAMKRFLKTTKKYCLILEDDILGNDSDIQAAIDFTTVIPSTGIAVLGGLQGLKNKKYVYGKKNHDSKNHNSYKIHNACKIFLARTCCYLVTRSTAKKIIANQKPKLVRADQWDIILNGVNEIYYLDLFSHPKNPAHSHIEKYRKEMQKTFFARLLSDGVYKSLKRLFLKLHVIFIAGALGYEEVPSK